MVLVGIDIGTHGTKGVLVRSNGEVCASAHRAYSVLHPHPLWAEQNGNVWLAAAIEVINELVHQADRPGDIAGVCVSGLYGGSGIPVDKQIRPIRPCLIWMDRRAVDEVEAVRHTVAAEKLLAVSGNTVDTYFGFTKLLWLKENEPENWDRTALFLPPNAYVNYHLTGEIAIDHSSAGNLGGVYDLKNRCWSKEMAEVLGIPLEKMPSRLVPSDRVIGTITRDAAVKTGLCEGTPVLAGGVDAPMATLAAGAAAPGHNVAMMGTSTCWGVIHSGAHVAERLVSMPHVADSENTVYTWGGAATSGALVEWAVEILQSLHPQAMSGSDVLRAMDERAARIAPGADGLIAMPYFMGERAPLWDQNARGAFVGLTLAHSSAHIFRAILEASAFSLRQAIEAGVEMGLPISGETMVVGGVAKSPLWMSILADVTGQRMKTIRAGGFGAPLADAFLAGKATGKIDPEANIGDWIEYTEGIAPDAAKQERYERLYRIYRTTYKALSPVYDRLSAPLP